MVIAYYMVGAAVAAWIITGNGHLDWKLSLLVLPTMFLGHLCFKAIAGRRRTASRIVKCLACQKELGLFRRLDHARFCCNDHEQVYLAELQEVAIGRLQGAHIAASLDLRVESALQNREHVNVAGRDLVKVQSIANTTA